MVVITANLQLDYKFKACCVCVLHELLAVSGKHVRLGPSGTRAE